MENECLECGALCDEDYCRDCRSAFAEDEPGADHPPAEWYDGWEQYSQEYE